MPTGPSSSQSPYLVASQPTVTFSSIITTGDQVAGAPTPFVGTPDGIGVFDNGDGTATVVVNHELAQTAGAVRGHGSTGSFVDRFVINESTLQVVSERDAVTSASNVFQDANGDGVYEIGTTAWERFCSGDLAPVTAFFNPATGLGTTDRIYLTGEETSPPFTPSYGRAWGFVLTGPDANKVFELPRMGELSFENLVTNQFTGNRTLVMMQDDTGSGTATPDAKGDTGGEVYMYLGTKQSTGNAVEKAGLTNGTLYGVHVNGIVGNDESATTAFAGDVSTFTMIAMPDQSNRTGVQLEADSEAAGITEFLRPEDGAWDPTHPNWYYFNTTASFTGPSRLWRMEFTDINNPTAGGTIRELLTGVEGQRMLDNMTIMPDGKVVLVEDVGNNAFIGRTLIYDPDTDSLQQLGAHDPARFQPGAANFITQDEEASGPIDVTSMFGNSERQAVLLDTQAHNALPNPLVEGGQLQIMYIDTQLDGGFFRDFGGDGKSDLLLRSDTGAVTLWQISGTQLTSSTSIGAVGHEWKVDSNADFNGDGKADVLWRSDAGSVVIWQMNGTQISASNTVGTVGSEWHIAGSADFNGDGNADILWNANDGTVTLWQMNGSQIAANNTVGHIASDLHVVQTADFTGDGKADILWRADDGAVSLWEMNGSQMVSNTALGKAGLEWHVEGAADLNNDKSTDILWRADDGRVVLWQMNGAHVSTTTTIGTVGNEWRLFGTGDFDGDGKGDILWRSHDGSVEVWEMNGATIVAQQVVSAAAADTTLAGHHFDFV
jgi:hypothetical protein